MSLNTSELWWVIYTFSRFDKKQKSKNKSYKEEKDNKCFQYAIIGTLNQKEMKKDHKGQQKLNHL